MRSNGALRRALPALVLAPWLLGATGCSELPVQIGKDTNPSKADRKGHVGSLEDRGTTPTAPAPGGTAASEGTDPFDPRYEQALAAYRQSYLFWSGEQKQLVDNVAGNTLAFNGAYERIRAHLRRMSRYLAPEQQEKLAGYLNQYESLHALVAGGNRGRFVDRQAKAIGDHVRQEFGPSNVTIIPIAIVGPEPFDGPEVAGGPEPAGVGSVGGGAGTGNPSATSRAPQSYATAYADWRSQHKTLLDSLFSETPRIDEPYQGARGALERMKTDLPAGDQERLQMFLNEYQRTAQGFIEGVSARQTVNQFRTIATEIERNFAPEVAPFP